jgi:radical SAM-linked protein
MLRALPFTANLPWCHIRKGPTVEKLQEERQRTSVQLREYQSKLQSGDQASESGPGMEYGRSKKRVASKSQVAPTKNRMRLRWGKSDRYRFMSHLDNLRLLERSIRIARIPVAFSQGYHPTMKLSFGPPLPLGFTSEAEYVDITLESNLMPYMIEKLSRALPEGFEVLDAGVVLGKAPSLSSLLNRVEYRVNIDDIDSGSLQQRIDAVMASEKLVIERVGKNKTTEVEIRSAIYRLETVADSLEMSLGIGEGGYARPDEVLAQILTSESVKPITYRLHRSGMYRIDERGNRIDPMQL